MKSKPYFATKKLGFSRFDPSQAGRVMARDSATYLTPMHRGGHPIPAVESARDLAISPPPSFVPSHLVEVMSIQSEAPVYIWEPVSTDDGTQLLTIERFEALRNQWSIDTEFASSATEQFMHPAYQQIIGMGRDGLPLILRDLRDNPAHWFWALAAISGDDHADGADTFEEARERWLAWGAREGYLT